jgi:hypothetical protein
VNNTKKHRGFYVEVTWADLGTIVLALALVLAARWLWSLDLGAVALWAGIALWWAGACVFLRWIMLHSLSANDYASWAGRLAAGLGGAYLLVWALDAAGLQPAWAAWVGQSLLIITVAIYVWYSWKQRADGGRGGDARAAGQGAN